MAQEIEFAFSLKYEKGKLIGEIKRETQKLDMAGSRDGGTTQDIGFAAHEQIDWGPDFGTLGVFAIKNMDATNYVEVGIDVAGTFHPFEKVLPGETWPSRAAGGVVVYAKANSAAVKIKATGLEA